MKLLLTSNGITNESIRRALVELLGKPIEESSALFVATGMYPFSGGLRYAWQAIAGTSHHPFSEMGWKTFGNLELSVLPSIDKEVWKDEVAAADALLVWGGDPIFLAHWLHTSGVADAIAPQAVYVGVSAGSMVACERIVETYTEPRRCAGDVLSAEEVLFPDGGSPRTLVTARGMGWVDFAMIPHYRAKGHEDASAENTKVWASKVPAVTYAIDDDTALRVVDGQVDVVSEGVWERFPGSSG